MDSVNGLQVSRHHPPTMTVITATTRLSRELRLEFDRDKEAAGLASWPSSEIMPLSTWLQDVWTTWLFSDRATASSARLLRPSEERVVWEAEIRSQAGNQLLDVPATAEAALKSWKLLCDWHLPLDNAAWRDSADSEAFRAWAGAFRDRCREKGWFSNAELASVVTDLIERNAVPVPEEVEFAGFHERTPAQQRLVDALARRGVEVRDREPPDRASDAVRVGLADVSREIRAAAEWARRILEHEPEAASPNFRVGIVAPDLEQRRGEIERVFGEVFHPRARLRPDLDPTRLFNISLGLPLDKYPIIQAAFLILGTDPGDIPIERAGRILRSPFLQGTEAEMTGRAQLDVALRSRRQTHVVLWEIIRLARNYQASYHCPALVEQFGPWTDLYRNLQGPRLPSDWAPVISDFLKDVGWPGDRALDSIEYQTLEVWNKRLTELSGLDSVTGPIPFRSAVSTLEILVSDTSELFQPESAPAPVHILGVLEIAGLRFERLWVMGMQDGAWPQVRSPDPFLPLRLQRDFRTPGALPEQELAYYRMLTGHLLKGAPSVIVSYPEREDDSDLRVSPLFAPLTERSLADLGLITSPSYAERLVDASAMETIQDHRGPPCDDTSLRGGTYLFKLQAACPFKAFAELRLGARAPDDPEPGLDALDRGRLIHRILERVWAQLRSHEGLMSAAEDRLTDLVRLCVRSEIQQQLGDRALSNPRFVEIEKTRLEGMIQAWLLLETKRQPFTVLKYEEKRRVQVGGMEVGIRADRVDRLENGEIVIIDYKTGTCGVPDWYGTRPKEPQLPVYAVTADAPVAGVVFAKLKTGDTRFLGLARSSNIAPGIAEADGKESMEELFGVWRKVLAQLAREFSEGHANVDPRDRQQTCRFCALTSLCRIHQGLVDLEA